MVRFFRTIASKGKGCFDVSRQRFVSSSRALVLGVLFERFVGALRGNATQGAVGPSAPAYRSDVLRLAGDQALSAASPPQF